MAKGGLPLVQQLGGGLGFRSCQEGQLIPAGNEDWGKTGQDLPGIFAVKVRDAPEME